MPDDPKPHIVEEVEQRLDERTAPDRAGNRKYAARSTGRNVAALRAEQEDETAQAVTGGGPEHLTSGQWRGLIFGGAIGAAIGAAVFLLFGFIPFMEPLGARLVLLAICGFLAGAAAGGVYGAGRLPELEGETMDVEGRPSSGTTLRDPHTDERGR